MAEAAKVTSSALVAPPSAEATSSATGEAGFFANLESLRGVCALAIVAIHLPFASHLRMIPGIHQAWMFVDLFFVLSGFVIAHVYLQRISTPGDVRSFTIKRFFRLYPLHLLTMLVMAALLLARYLLRPADTVTEYGIDADFWEMFVGNLLLVHAWMFRVRQILNTASWSISTELLAYLAFAAACLLSARRDARVAIMAGLAGLALLGMIAFEDATLDGDPALRVIRCFYGFGLGVVAWRVALQSWSWSAGASLAVQLAALAGLLTLLPLSAANEHLTLLFPLVTLVLVVAMVKDPGSWLRSIWETRPLRLLGQLSFSIYLVHSPVITLVGAIINARFPWLESAVWWGDLAAAIVFALTIAVSRLTFALVEVPGRKLGQRLADGRGREDKRPAKA